MAVGGNAHGGSPDGVSDDSWPAEAIMWLGIGGAVLVAVAMFVAIKRRQAGGHKGSRSSRGASFAIKVKVEEGKPGTGLQLVSDGVVPSSGFVVGTEPFDADLIVSEPSMHSIQAGPSEHVAISSQLLYTSHSCDPNCKIVVDKAESEIRLVSLAPIPAGQPLSFDYATTEESMASPFPCSCEAPSCRGFVSGFSALKQEDRDRLAGSGLLSPFIQSVYDEAARR